MLNNKMAITKIRQFPVRDFAMLLIFHFGNFTRSPIGRFSMLRLLS